MHKIVSLFILSIFTLFSVPAFSATYSAADCTYSSVSMAVSSADDGDTVTIPACSETTWTTSLTITKAIILQGAGSGSTLIKGGTGVDSYGVIKYIPGTPDTNHRFRITGIGINNGGLTNCIYLSNTTTTYEFVRIDNNAFAWNTTGRGVYSLGTFAGVIDSNTFTMGTPASGSGPASFYGLDATSWTLSRDFGSQYNFYFEDNTVTDSGLHGSGQGGRYASRYNTVTATGLSDVSEFHGNQPGSTSCVGASTCGNASTMVVEIYGNHFNLGSSGAGNVVDQRGGQALIFNNKITNGVNSAWYVREEYADALWPSGSLNQHIDNSYSWANISTKQGLLPVSLGTENCGSEAAEAWQSSTNYGTDITCKKWTNDPNGYTWKATHYCTGYSTGISGSSEPDWSGTAVRYCIADGGIRWVNMGLASPIAEGTNFWTQKSGTFDGGGITGGGVGCGTLASRPATCTTGVGYWATNQSCSDLTGMIGASPSTPISGTLYKCTATNTWTAYYTPYTYPHPLRGIASFRSWLPSGVVESK